MKLKKLKATFIAAMVAMATLITTVPVYAEHVSSDSTEFRGKYEKRTVVVVGSSGVMSSSFFSSFLLESSFDASAA